MKTEAIRIRLTRHQKLKLKAYADKKQTTVSHILTDYINRLPNPGDGADS